MDINNKFADEYLARIDEKDIACFLCGKEPSAYWVGDKGLFCICKNCAINLLPKLIADSIFLKHPNPAFSAKSTLQTIVGRYWQGIAFRVGRKKD